MIADDHAARHAGDLMLLLADQGHGQHLALVVRARLAAAVERLEPLGMGDGGRKQARDIVRHVTTADQRLRRMQQLALSKDGEAGAAAAHVDDRRAELALILDEGGEAGGEWRGDEVRRSRGRNG